MRKNKSQKIALVYSEGPPVWQSAQTIRNNLIAAYETTGVQLQRFATRYDNDGLKATLRALEKYKPDIIVIPESYPVPILFLRALFALPKLKPQIHLHLYGDFTIATDKWLSLEPILAHYAIRFYVASQAQQRLVRAFMRNSLHCKSDSGVVICPFPIKNNIFEFEPNKHEANGPSRSTLNLLYTGRLSRQKGVFLFLQWLVRLRSETSWAQNIRVKFAGTFDDLGTPLWGQADEPGTSFALWQNFMKTHNLHDSIEYVGNLGAQELKTAYNEADAYVSLSLYHDEDYGMSPLEALSCGAPCVLTDWGGFGSFAIRAYDEHHDVALCRTQIDNDGVTVSYSDFCTALEHLYKLKFSAPNLEKGQNTRRERAQIYHQTFSIRAIGAKIAEFLNSMAPKFVGFSPLMRRQAARIQGLADGALSGPPPYRSASRQDPVYFETYRNYVSLEK